MARVPLIGYEAADDEVRGIYDEYVVPRYARHGMADAAGSTPHIIQPWRAWANCPQLMKHEAILANFIVEECGWSVNNTKLRALMSNAIYHRYRSASYGLRAHMQGAAQYYSREQIALLDDLAVAQRSDLFDHDEQTILAFCSGVLDTGDCRDEVWADLVDRWGYDGAIEFTATFAFWLMWVPIFAVFRTEPDDPREH